MTRPWKTTEFWVMVVSLIVTTVGWVDFPIEAWGAIISWILGRSFLKAKATK